MKTNHLIAAGLLTGALLLGVGAGQHPIAGYSDGTFRPVVPVAGYSDGTFRPAAPVAYYQPVYGPDYSDGTFRPAAPVVSCVYKPASPGSGDTLVCGRPATPVAGYSDGTFRSSSPVTYYTPVYGEGYSDGTF